MDKKYKIDWCEVKRTGNTNGREWKIMEMALRDEEDKVTDKVSTFETVAPGMELEGKIVTNDKGYLTFVKKLEAPAFIKGNSNYKAQQIEKTMERKETSIKGFQDDKNWSIKTASTMNKAIDLAIAEGKPEPITILKWREWVWNNWEVDEDQYPPFISKD